MRAILSRELKTLWASPVPYALGAAFHVALGALGSGQLIGRRQAVFQPLVPIAGFLLVVAVPVLSARALAEEGRGGALDLLLSIPVRAGRIVAGKYLALLGTVVVVIAPIGIFVAVLLAYGDPDIGPVVAGLGGLLLMAAALCAVGLACSALTSSQTSAAVAGLGVLLAFWFAHAGSEVAPTGGVQSALSISERLRTFAGGTIELTDVVFFLSLAVAGIAIATAAVAGRRWR